MLSEDDVIDELDPKLGPAFPVSNIGAGDSISRLDLVGIGTNVTDGRTYRLGMLVDPGAPDSDFVDEFSDENNDILSDFQITIGSVAPSIADLELASLDGPNTASPNSTIAVQTVVKENNSAPIGAFEVEYLLANREAEFPLATVSRLSLQPWTESITLPGNIPAGDYSLIAAVNGDAAIAERDFSNNTLQDLGGIRILDSATVADPEYGFQYPIGDPINGSRVTQHFGKGFGRLRGHFGTHFGAPVGTPIHAAADRIVTASISDAGTGWGPVLILSHPTKNWG